MNPKELLLSALKRQPTPRPPWVPFAGAYAARLKGFTASEFFRDEDKMTACLLAVNRLFKPDGQCCIFDLQVEAEVLGCTLRWAEDGPPTVVSHPLDCDEDEEPFVPCDCRIPGPEDGRIPMICRVMRRMKKEVGEETALYGLITGPLTLASHLRGSKIFTDLFDDEDYVRRLLAFCTRVAFKMAEYYIGAGMDVIAVVDPLISQISVHHFEAFAAEPFRRLFSHIRALGAAQSFFVCGDATRNLEAMCRTGCDSIFVDENVNLQLAKRICDPYGVAIGGNIPLTTVMLHGTQQENMKYVLDLVDSFSDRTGLIVATGCDMPFGVPFENTVGCMQAVLHPEEVRAMVRDYVAPEATGPEVALPDYAHLTKPLVEVFTLDPATCAACTYMKAAADEIKALFGDAIDYRVYKYTEKDEIPRFQKMGVPSLPSLYLNGELKFRSIIPSREELAAAIRAVLS